MKYVSVADKAEEWHVSKPTVQKYCREGMILDAEKSEETGPWLIPENAEKPLLTRRQVRILLEAIESIQGGARMNLRTLGMSEKEMIAGYGFIMQRGYCSWFQFLYTRDQKIDYQRTFHDVTINPSGIRLIEADQRAMERQEAREEKETEKSLFK